MTDINWEDFPWNQYKTDMHIEISEDQTPGRIIAQEGPVLFVVTESGTGEATVSGRLTHLTDAGTEIRPAVGDYVAISKSGPMHIESVLPRASVYRRKAPGSVSRPQIICANIDMIAIMSTVPATGETEKSSELADFSIRRIERFVATMDDGVRPVVILNKCDLIDDVQSVIDFVSAELPGAEVMAISALTGLGVEAVESILTAGTTTAIVGSSGCGKSTLVNRLAGSEIATAEIREIDGRGRHTTTTRRMHKLRSGGLLVDTPGMREVQLWADDESADDPVLAAFPEISDEAGKCRFSDCRHTEEPGCAVKQAVQDGRITQDRYLSYLELREEATMHRGNREHHERLLHRKIARRARTRRRSRGG